MGRVRAPSVLVTDAETRSAVAACRGLAAAGFRVAAVAGHRPAVAHWSRTCHERLSLPHPLEDPDGFVVGLEAAAESGRYAALLPVSDAALLAVSSGRERLDRYVRTGLPPQPAVQRGLSKLDLVELAVAAGLDPPETVVCHGVDEALRAARELGFPVVIKAARSVVRSGAISRQVGSVLVDCAESLARLAPRYGEPCLLQRAERPRVVSFAGVMASGRLLALAVSRYRRTWYPEAGNVCFSETIPPCPVLSERVRALLARLGWEGIFELELIERADGSYAAIDLNPRVYGSLALAVAAGANLPAIWCERVLGGDPEPATARPGVRYRWEDADLRHLLRQARRGRLRAAASVLRPHRRVVHPHFRLDDPGPLIARAVELASLAAGRPSAGQDVRDRGAATGRKRRPLGEVVVIGAGPYGLAAAAHLRHAGVPAHVFGDVLEFWRTRMPAGMILRSRKRSTHIADPERALRIEAFEADQGRQVTTPNLTLAEFIDYGRWFQQRAVPDVDPRKVKAVEREDGPFRFALDDGEEGLADRVVVAAGLFPFGRRPEPFASLPESLVSHSADHADLGRFSGQRVIVVGAGQSALESAALLCEAGADVEVIARIGAINWLKDGDDPNRRRTLRERLPLPPTDVGGFATGWTAAMPDMFRRLPRGLQPIVSERCIRPAGSAWLRPRMASVPLTLDAAVVAAEPAESGVRIMLADGSERVADHVLLGTGYDIDVSRYPFLGPGLARSVEMVDGYPVLGPGLESSVPGLHFLGAPAAATFGPIMRFVVGTWYAAPALARRAAGDRQPPVSFAF